MQNNAPDVDEAVGRFNQGRAAVRRSLESIQEQDISRYENESRTAWTEVVGALEWGVKYCLETFCAAWMPEEKLEKLDEESFDKLLKTLAQHARPRFPVERTRKFHLWRRTRNAATHQGGLASHRELREAFHGIRRFLLDYLPVAEEKLPPLPLPGGQREEPEVVADPDPLFPPHRAQRGGAWIEQCLRAGLERLRYSRPQDQDGVITTLEKDAPELLTRNALQLLEEGRRADGLLELTTERAEEEAKALLLGGMVDSGLPRASAERVLRLLPLLRQESTLCIEAGWLRREDKGLGFEDFHLAALLVGRRLARSGAEAVRLTGHVGRERSWAEAAWMAVAEGDDLASWSKHLLEERDPLVLLERVVVTCAAFGATPAHTVISDEMVRAYQLCVCAMVAFAPRHVSDREKSDASSPWFLPPEHWRRCVLDLAHASKMLGAGLDLPLCRAAVPLSVPSPLAEVLSSLTLPERLSAEAATAIAVLCAPDAAARSGLLDDAFFAQVFGAHGSRLGALVEEPFLQTWFQDRGIPALRNVGGESSLRLLALPVARNPAGYLLNRASLIPQWFEAWSRLCPASPDEAAQAWVEAVRRLCGLGDSSEELRQQVLVRGLAQLESLGCRAQVVRGLRERVEDLWPQTDRGGEQLRTQAEVLRLLEFGMQDWEARFRAAAEEPAMGWRTLLEAGAPQSGIAWWCVQKHLQKQKAPEAFQHGPVGIIPLSGIEVLGSGPWQLAFQQAEEALQWLLAEGDANAILVLADACLAPRAQEPGFNPSMHKFAGMDLSLSMVLWRKVLPRAAGREALYAWVKAPRFLGEYHYLSDPPLPLPSSEAGLWHWLVEEVWKSAQALEKWLEPAPLPADGGAEARRLVDCLERRMGGLWVTEQAWPSLRPRFEEQGWPEPPGFPCWVSIDAVPWELPWPRLLTKTLYLAHAAEQGVDVTEPLLKVGGLLQTETEDEANQAAPYWGHALLRLSEHRAGQAKALLALSLSPDWLQHMCGDRTAAFWAALVRAHGSARVFEALADVGRSDFGLGLVDALLRLDLRALRERERLPQLMRPVLVRASERAYIPSEQFWAEAWAVPREVEAMPELPQLPPGSWLEKLLERSQRWEPRARQRLVGHLARFSLHDEVRRRCLGALLEY